MEININKIRSIASNEKTFERGLDYYKKGYIKKYKVINNSNGIVIFASVLGSFGNNYNIEIIINKENEIISTCDCEAYHTYQGSCKHIVSVLIEYAINSKKNNILSINKKLPTTTDKVAIDLIDEYIEVSLNVLYDDTTIKKARLIPTLEYDNYAKLTMNFRIGYERTYVIKDLDKFYEDMTLNSTVVYGKMLTFVHNADNFDEQSKPLVNFLMKLLDQRRTQRRNSYYSTSDIRSVLIASSSLDEIFKLLINDKVMFILPKEQQMITFLSENPNLDIYITQNNKKAIELNFNYHNLLYLNGFEYCYVLLDNVLYQVDSDYANKVGIFIKLMKNKKSIIINKKDMSNFYSHVLDEMKNYVNIVDEGELLKQYESAPLISKIYIDLPKNNLVTATLKFFYNDEEANEQTEIINRNMKKELLAQTIVLKYFDSLNKEKNLFIIEDDEERIFNLYLNGLDMLTKYMEVFATDKFKQFLKNPPKIKIGVKVNHNLLDIEFDAGEFPINELLAVLNSYNHQKKYHRLKDGSFVSLEDSSLSELANIVEGLDIGQKEIENGLVQAPIYRALYLDDIVKKSESIHSERDFHFKSIVRDINDVVDTHFELPVSLKTILRNYQKEGFSWLKTLSHYGFGGILADDMGLGKTLQVITLILSYLSENNEIKPTLIVCPASLVLNWEMEINKFTKNLKVLPVIGSISARKNLISKIKDYQIVITSYDYLKRDIELYDNIEFIYHIIDEAQYIKNHTTLNAKSVKKIDSQNRFALTGTPIENSLSEIWSIFDFVMPGYLFSFNKFSTLFEKPIINNNDELKLDKLKKMVVPFILRRLKKDVLKELPNKTESTVYTNLEGEQKKLYLANVALIKEQLNKEFDASGFNNNKILVLSMLTRLRQICCDPALYYEDYHKESAKLSMCMELIDNSIDSGHKILLFSQFTSMLAIIEKKLIEKNISYNLLIGATKKEERKRLVDDFNENEEKKIFLISLKAGGTGLNLTGADVVIHYDPWWNISAQNQATDRTHRIGQKQHVQVYKLITKNTIEEKILKLQEHKIKLSDSIIEENNGIISKMTKDEIMDLFDYS